MKFTLAATVLGLSALAVAEQAAPAAAAAPAASAAADNTNAADSAQAPYWCRRYGYGVSSRTDVELPYTVEDVNKYSEPLRTPSMPKLRLRCLQLRLQLPPIQLRLRRLVPFVLP